MFFKDDRDVYRAGALAGFSWLEHGFGTRHSAAWPDPWRLVLLKQIHSTEVVRVDGGRGYAGEGDALVTDRPGLLVGVRSADCVPILLADPEKRAVAALHAGWRGSADGIVARAVETLAREYGSAPQDLYAAIGPAIGACCYEIGPEVAERFDGQAVSSGNGKSKLDLTAVNRGQLLAAGLSPEKVSAGVGCTRCNREFHSYRRDGQRAGRLISAIGIL